ncbi:MAG TPA: transglutaminase domain-containing protein, partial [Armatimonadota bacterium]
MASSHSRGRKRGPAKPALIPPDFARLAPLYVAAFVIILCGISAVNSTLDDGRLTGITIALALVGTFTSLLLRVWGVSQSTVGWVVSGVTLFLLVSGSTSITGFVPQEGAAPDPQRALGMLLEWGTILFSFTMLTNSSLLFAIIPCMALLGLMSSENLNPEMVTYFLGFVLATVFAMGYDGFLARQGWDEGAPVQRRSRVAAPIGPVVRSFLALSTIIVGGAFVVALVVSTPLKELGQNVFQVTSVRGGPNLPMLPHLGSTASDSMSLIGNPPPQSSQPVLTVDAPEPVYLRGVVYKLYNGQSWTKAQSFTTRLDPVSEDSNQQRRFAVYAQPPGWRARRRLVQRITVEAPVGPEVHAAADPVEVSGRFYALSRTDTGTLRSDSLGAMEEDSLGTTDYTVASRVSTATPSQLRQAHVRNRPFTDFRADREAVADRVTDLARTITLGARTPFDKAQAIASYLRSNYTYSLEPPLLPEEEDATGFFLFKTRTGYCEHFASAMAILCRSLGIPARVAAGYAPGDWDPASHRWIVRQLHAHAWTEVDFGEFGWIPFDPTGGLRAEPAGYLSLAKLLSHLTRILTSRELVPRILMLCLMVMALYLVKVEAWDRWGRPAWRSRMGRRASSSPVRQLSNHYRRFCHQAARLGAPRDPRQT